MIKVQLPNSIEECTRIIEALEAVIPYDNSKKDKAIHGNALIEIREHREYLLLKLLKNS